MYAYFQITNILDKSPIWREYKEQKHDLFISDTPIAGYLTGNVKLVNALNPQTCQCVWVRFDWRTFIQWISVLGVFIDVNVKVQCTAIFVLFCNFLKHFLSVSFILFHLLIFLDSSKGNARFLVSAFLNYSRDTCTQVQHWSKMLSV